MKLLTGNGHIAFSARFGLGPSKSGRSRRGVRCSPDRANARFADNQHHAKRLCALAEGTSRKLHGFGARRSSVPGERSSRHVWRQRYI
jgi:hypothetical protein